MPTMQGDEYGERLFVRGREVGTEDGEVFDLLASEVADIRLSEIPPGYRVQLCYRLIGSTRELYTRPPHVVYEKSDTRGLVAHFSTPMIPEQDDLTDEGRQEWFVRSLDAGERALEPLRQAGRLISLERDIFDEIAFLNFTITLHDQTFGEAELFVSEIDARASEAYQPPRLFVSHASEDKHFVDRLVAELDRQAWFAWYDKREILVGDSIVDKVTTGLESSDYLIAVLSPRSVRKPWVVRELNSSLMRQLGDTGIIVLPVLLEPCDLPGILADIKYADFTKSFSEGLRDLLAAIRRRDDGGA